METDRCHREHRGQISGASCRTRRKSVGIDKHHNWITGHTNEAVKQNEIDSSTTAVKVLIMESAIRFLSIPLPQPPVKLIADSALHYHGSIGTCRYQ